MPSSAPDEKKPTRRPRVPRWVVFVVVCVFLGVVTSVGVAWGLAARFGGVRLAPPYDACIPIGLAEEHGRRRLVVWQSRFKGSFENTFGVRPVFLFSPKEGPFFSQEEFGTRASDVLSTGAVKRIESQWSHTLPPIGPATSVRWYGFPWLCFGLTEDFANKVTSHAVAVKKALLPTFPLWPGLLADTAFYGGAWAILLGTPILIRRWLRNRRGGCPGCGYSLEGLKDGAPCPECGRGSGPAPAPSSPPPAVL